jgi:hypothetical protein
MTKAGVTPGHQPTSGHADDRGEPPHQGSSVRPAAPQKMQVEIMAAPRPLNPFESERGLSQATSTGAMVETERAIAEVQAAIMLAKRFPRDKVTAVDQILTQCTRISLAESAIYSYPKGGQEITGPSIRLAEVIAQSWGNFQFGWDELSRREGMSEILAFAWDVETNVRRTMKFVVRHWRDTKKGGYAIKDERDIYELCANQAQRRVRACILNTIPGDVTEAAVAQCDETIKLKSPVTAESIQRLLGAFEEFGVSKAQIEKRLGRKVGVDSMNAAVMAQLRKIYTGIRDGMSKVEEFFEPDLSGSNPGAGSNAVDSGAGEGQAKAAVGKTGGSIPPTGANAQPQATKGEDGGPAEASDWEAYADQMIEGLAGCADEKTLDVLLNDLQEDIGKLQASADKAAMKKWAAAVQARRNQLTGKGRLAV